MLFLRSKKKVLQHQKLSGVTRGRAATHVNTFLEIALFDPKNNYEMGEELFFFGRSNVSACKGARVKLGEDLLKSEIIVRFVGGGAIILSVRGHSVFLLIHCKNSLSAP